MPGPTGERDVLSYRGRGVFVCISPWNFPLAIFLGQVAGALAAGNAVVAKPAEQTPLIAFRAFELLHEAGIPKAAAQLVPGDGKVGAALVAHPAVAGVAFTGSTEVAWAINRTLAAKAGPIVPLIAETGGINAMIVDATALPEQVTDDVVSSAFRSAGQRCSALRLLCLQDEVAEPMLAMIAGAAAELALGDPADPATDIGPVIDAEAKANLDKYLAEVRKARWAKLRYAGTTPRGALARGTYVAPHIVELDGPARLTREVFGPILHVVRWKAGELDRLTDAIAATGYGLTLGIHTRIDETVRRIVARLPVGNVYVNRNMIGAVVGTQPFGGSGLSGTGPKAGGPDYLRRFALEQVVSTNTAAAGGNASLIAHGRRVNRVTERAAVLFASLRPGGSRRIGMSPRLAVFAISLIAGAASAYAQSDKEKEAATPRRDRRLRQGRGGAARPDARPRPRSSSASSSARRSTSSPLRAVADACKLAAEGSPTRSGSGSSGSAPRSPSASGSIRP